MIQPHVPLRGADEESLISITASTSDADEYLRLIDWCFDVAALSGSLAACSENGVNVARVTLPGGDARLMEFARRVEGRASWTVERWP